MGLGKPELGICRHLVGLQWGPGTEYQKKCGPEAALGFLLHYSLPPVPEID